MPEQPKPREMRYDPETERKMYLVAMFEKGLSDTQGTIGYHATSIESIQYLIRTGHLPGSQSEELPGAHNAWRMQKGDLYFYPRKSKFPDYDPNVSKYFLDEGGVIVAVSDYAHRIASVHYLLTKLNLGLENQDYNNGARELLSGMFISEIREFRETLYSLDITDAQIDQALKEAKERKGIILGLGVSLLKTHQVRDGDRNAGDLRINFPSGMDYTYISGVESFGKHEREFFSDIKKSLSR